MAGPLQEFFVNSETSPAKYEKARKEGQSAVPLQKALLLVVVVVGWRHVVVA